VLARFSELDRQRQTNVPESHHSDSHIWALP
jgi:hypothetical protein